MKRFLLLLALCGLLLPIVQPARGADVSVNFFYDNLSGGNWYEVSDYGYVWQPEVATNSNWRPYADGYWAYTDQGWTWVSYEDFGWATYHYGRWARLADYGWVWVPGTEWAPAWVSWRTGGDYVGWAPLPPAGGGEVVYEGRPISGHVDVEFGIGPAYYNFIDLRYIGEPVLSDRILPYNRNVTIINNTVNVTNITYNNSTVYNYGPDYATVSRYSVRPVQRLKLERQSADPMQAIRSGSVMKKEGNTLVVAAPQKLQKASAQVAPKQVKAKIEQPKVEKGWADIYDPAAKAKLEQKFKSENVKDVPKPTIQPRKENAGVNAEAAGVAAAPSPAEHAGKGKQKGAEAAQRGAPTPVVAASPSAAEQGKPGKNRNRAERAQAQPSPGAGTQANENQPVNTREGNARHNKANKHEANGTPAGSEDASASERNEFKNKPENAKRNRAGENVRATNGAQARPNNEPPVRPANEPRVRAHNQQQGQQAQPNIGLERQREQVRPVQVPPPNAAGPGVRPQRETAHANAPGQQQKAEQGANQPKGKGKKKEGEATPAPQ